MRLAKFLAHAGVASRRASEEIVAAGRVTVGGTTVHGSRAGRHGRQPGVRRRTPADRARGARGVRASTSRSGSSRPPATPTDGRSSSSWSAAAAQRLYPVGRLDAADDGLILLTNDGELANRLTHPRFEVPKTYRARVGGGPPARRRCGRCAAGWSSRTDRRRPARVRRLGPQELEITIREGRNRQVRRMCEHVGHPVLELERTRFGPLRLGDLAAGRVPAPDRRQSSGGCTRL